MSRWDDPAWQVPELTDEIFAPYALAIGQAALAWNSLHEAIGMLYHSLIHIRLNDRRRRAERYLIGMVRDDSQKRAKLRDGVELKYKNDSIVYDAVMELLAQTELLAEYRNDLIHAPLVAPIARDSLPADPWAGWRIDPGSGAMIADPEFKSTLRREIVPNAYDWNKRAMNFHEDSIYKPDTLLERLQSCRDQAIALKKFAVEIDRGWHTSPTLPPAPARPSWWVDADAAALKAKRKKREDDRQDLLLEKVHENGEWVFQTRYIGG